MRKVLLIMQAITFFAIGTFVYPQHSPIFSQEEMHLTTLLEQAVYGQELYEARIAHFKKILALIGSTTSSHFIRSYAKALQGLFIARPHSDIHHLVLLRDLFLGSKKVTQLHTIYQLLDEWVGVINKSLESFALQDGDIVRIRNDKRNEWVYALAVKRVQQGISSLFLTSDKKVDVQIGASLFRIKKNSGIGKVIHYGDSVVLEPLFVQVNNFIYASPANSLVSLIHSVRRGAKLDGVGIAWGSSPSPSDENSFILKKNTELYSDKVVFTSDFPVLQGDGIIVMHEHSGLAFAGTSSEVDQYKKARLSLKKIGPGRHPSRKSINKSPLLTTFVFSFERIDTEELYNIRRAQFDYLLKRAKENDVLQERIGAYEAALQLLTDDVSQDKQDALSHALQELFYQRKAESKLLKELRALLIQAAKHPVFEHRRIEFENYVGQINKDLVPLGIQYGDVVQLCSVWQGKQLLWVHGDSRYQSGGHLEVVAGPYNHENTRNGPQLFKVHSAEGKSGAVQYGDPLELLAMYAGSGTKNGSLGAGQKLWVNPTSYCGKQFFEVLVGPNSCNQAQNGQEVFFLRPQKDFAKAVATRVNPVLSGDTIELWSRQFGRKVWVNTSSLSVENSHEILVGPNDDNYLGVNRTENGQQLFALERVSKDQLVAIADADFYKRLLSVRQVKSFEQRVYAMQDFFAYISHNEYLSEEAKETFVELLQDLFEQRAEVEERLLAHFAGFLASISSEFFSLKQRSLLHKLAETLAIEKTERAIDTGFSQLAQHTTYLALINAYKELTPLIDSKYAYRKAAVFIDKLYELSLQVKNMKAQELNALKSLLTNALRLDYSVARQQDGTIKKLAYLFDINKELAFKAQLAEATQTQGVQQIQAYKALLPHAHQMSEQQRLELIRSLKGIFESKVNEIKEIKDVLEKANTSVLSHTN